MKSVLARRLSKASQVLAGVLVLLAMLIPAASAETRLNTFIEELNSFTASANEITTPEDYKKLVESRGTSLSRSAAAASEELASGMYKSNILRAPLEKLREDLSLLLTEVASPTPDDSATLIAEANEFTDATNIFVDAIDKNNVEVKSSNTSLTYVYGGLFGLFSLVSLWLFFWKRESAFNTQESEREAKLKQQARTDLFKASLLPFIASLVTLIWFLAIRNSGGTYYILWGPMLFGGIALLRAVGTYRNKITGGDFGMEAIRQQQVDSMPTVDFSVVVSTTKGLRPKYATGTLTIDSVQGTVTFPSGDPAQQVMIPIDKLHPTTYPSGRFIQFTHKRVAYTVVPVGTFDVATVPLKKIYKRKLSTEEQQELEAILYALKNKRA